MSEAVLAVSPYQPLRMELDDTVIIRLLGERNERAFEQVFKTHFRNLKVRSVYQSQTLWHMKGETDVASKRVLAKELESRLQQALNDLPEQCRLVFQLSRFEELRYREIADKLGISVKTVENQISKALKILRLQLADYLPVLIVFLIQSLIHL